MSNIFVNNIAFQIYFLTDIKFLYKIINVLFRTQPSHICFLFIKAGKYLDKFMVEPSATKQHMINKYVYNKSKTTYCSQSYIYT